MRIELYINLSYKIDIASVYLIMIFILFFDKKFNKLSKHCVVFLFYFFLLYFYCYFFCIYYTLCYIQYRMSYYTHMLRCSYIKF